MAGGSLGMTISIPDQVVLVGGTGKHLSDRFNYTPATWTPDQENRFSIRVGSTSPTKGLQSRLGPPAHRRGDYDDEYEAEPDSMYNSRRPHVLKRLGVPVGGSYSGWGNAYTPGLVGRGRRPTYSTSYRSGGQQQSSYNRSYGGYGSYGYYNPSSYYSSYPRPRYYNSYYASPFSFRGYGSYRGRYNNNNYSQRYNNRGRRGRYGRSSGREVISKEDLDRDLDEFRAGGSSKKDNGSS